ncbi:MAG TPA: hypothetical protein VN132_15705 [Bdellovibrio sp.]|nr:hypothetical protein [Bdellovibrio sp.]
MKKVILKSVMTLAIALAGSSAFAGGGGIGWTQCYAKDLGLSYSFDGYTQSFAVGKIITVFTTNEYGHYRINSVDLNGKVGVVELSHVPDSQNNAAKDTDFGNMKIEYFSNSALKDIQVTFTKDGLNKKSAVTCATD